MDKTILKLDSGWRIAYEENYICKDYVDTIQDIASLKEKKLPEIPASVPGNFELDLYKANVIGDPFFGLNTLAMQDLENRHVWYYTEFDFKDADGTEYIKFEGIDTIADIYVNGKYVKHVDNMYLSYEIDLPELKNGKNEILVHITPASIAAREFRLPPSSNAQEYAYDSLYIRKAAHMFGWDIMPRIVSCGIWKPVTILRRKADRIDDAFLYTTGVDPANQFAAASIFFHVDVSRDLLKDYFMEVEGTCGESRFYFKKRLWHIGGTFPFLDSEL